MFSVLFFTRQSNCFLFQEDELSVFQEAWCFVMTCHVTFHHAVEEEIRLRIPGPQTWIYTSPSSGILLGSVLELSCLPANAVG